jgi:small-conductance mechanosensitive channel
MDSFSLNSFVLQDWIVLLVTLVSVLIVVLSLRWLLLVRQKELSTDQRLPRQIIMLVVTIIAVAIVVLSLPVSESSRNQLLALLGVLLSGVIAFSSTTIVSNLMAGLVLRVNRPFRTGDFIRCSTFAGRVTEKGILDTEIQTEQRALIHVANSFLINNPVEVIRSSGTLISAQTSIGYDVHHSIIEKHLQAAAASAGLSDSFVHITELGDFSVNYKVSGLLLDTKSMLTTKSKLHGAILDELHNNDIEIMSPNIMAPRQVDPAYSFIAKARKTKVKETLNQEDIAFDKAEEAEQLEQQKESVLQEIAELKASLKSKDKSDEPENLEKSVKLSSQGSPSIQNEEDVQAQIKTLENKLLLLNTNNSVDE